MPKQTTRPTFKATLLTLWNWLTDTFWKGWARFTKLFNSSKPEASWADQTLSDVDRKMARMDRDMDKTFREFNKQLAKTEQELDKQIAELDKMALQPPTGPTFQRSEGLKRSVPTAEIAKPTLPQISKHTFEQQWKKTDVEGANIVAELTKRFLDQDFLTTDNIIATNEEINDLRRQLKLLEKAIAEYSREESTQAQTENLIEQLKTRNRNISAWKANKRDVCLSILRNSNERFLALSREFNNRGLAFPYPIDQFAANIAQLVQKKDELQISKDLVQLIQITRQSIQVIEAEADLAQAIAPNPPPAAAPPANIAPPAGPPGGPALDVSEAEAQGIPNKGKPR